MSIATLDLNFQGNANAIASFLVPHSSGAVLVESGPGSTTDRLAAELAAHGYGLEDIGDVLVTHIHLDHAGAAGWLASHGARVHVHPIGAPHLLDPARLLASAGRIYGDQMETLWGDFLPVPQDQLIVHQDGDRIRINDLEFLAIESPGHASHHFAYLLDDLCFCGDIGGVRLPGSEHIRLPTPPPEFMPELWLASIEKLKTFNISRLALTHFGIYEAAGLHLQGLETLLHDFTAWMAQVMPADPDRDALRDLAAQWERERALAEGVPAEYLEVLDTVNPAWSSADGIYRYWNKHRK